MDELLCKDLLPRQKRSYEVTYKNKPIDKTRELMREIESTSDEVNSSPLEEIADTDALEKLLLSAKNPIQVEFRYREYVISISSCGKIYAKST